MHSNRQSSAARNELKVLLIIVGIGCGLIFLACSGLIVMAVLGTRTAVHEVNNAIEMEMQRVQQAQRRAQDQSRQQQNRAPVPHPVNSPYIPPYNRPSYPSRRPVPNSLQEALAALDSLDNHTRNQGLDWFAQNSPNMLRADVAQAIAGQLPDPATHQAAMKALSLWATADVTDTMAQYLNETAAGGEESRKIAALKLASFRDPRALEPLANLLDNFFACKEAQQALLTYGPEAESAVLTKIHSTSGHAREAAQALIEAYQTSPEKVLDQTLLDLTSTDHQTVRSALDRLTKMDVIESRRTGTGGVLIGLMKSWEGFNVGHASKAAARWATAENSKELTPLLSSERHWRVALTLLGDLGCVDAAEEMMTHFATFGRRGDVASAMRRLGSGAEKAVHPYLYSDDWESPKTPANSSATSAPRPACRHSTKQARQRSPRNWPSSPRPLQMPSRPLRPASSWATSRGLQSSGMCLNFIEFGTWG